MDIQHVTSNSLLFPKKLMRSRKLSFLYYAGDISLLDKKCIAVIGKRQTSFRYEKISYQVGKVLAKNGYVVMNGLAIGCDEQSIMGALSEGGKVVAVLPCGLDNIYPSCCKELATQIIMAGGCLISQYPVGVKPEKYRFLERDKTQVQIADKIFVIDSGLSGGTMYTATYALQSGKNVECFVECERNTPDGNSCILDKYHLNGVRNTEELLDFVGYDEPEQMTITSFGI